MLYDSGVAATLYREQIVAQLAAALGPRAEILEAYVFGSVARGDNQLHSDLDIAVYVDREFLAREERVGFGGYPALLSTDLQQALRRSDIDLVLLNRANPLLYHEVLRDGQRVLSRDLAETTAREGYALSRYCDDVPRLQKLEAIQRARINAGDFGR